MYKSVYYNHKSVVLEQIIMLVFKRIVDLFKQNQFDFYGFEIIQQLFEALFIDNDINKVDLNLFKYLTDDYFNTFLYQQ